MFAIPRFLSWLQPQWNILLLQFLTLRLTTMKYHALAVSYIEIQVVNLWTTTYVLKKQIWMSILPETRLKDKLFILVDWLWNCSEYRVNFEITFWIPSWYISFAVDSTRITFQIPTTRKVLTLSLYTCTHRVVFSITEKGRVKMF